MTEKVLLFVITEFYPSCFYYLSCYCYLPKYLGLWYENKTGETLVNITQKRPNVAEQWVLLTTELIHSLCFTHLGIVPLLRK